jgi:hypothetical protein
MSSITEREEAYARAMLSGSVYAKQWELLEDLRELTHQFRDKLADCDIDEALEKLKAMRDIIDRIIMGVA